MTGRLPTAIGVGALLRRVNDAGGMAMVRAKGDPQAGAVLVLIDEGRVRRAVERGIGPGGATMLVEVRRVEVEGEGGDGGESLDDYWRRRRERDPDLWVVELTVAEAERFAAEAIGSD